MRKIVALSTVLALSLCANELPEYEVAPSFTKAITEGSSGIDDYSMPGLSLSKKISDDVMLNLSYAKGETDYKNSTVDSDIEIGFLNARYYFHKGQNLYAFATAGVGYQHFDRKLNGRDSGAKFNYGAGVKYYFNETVNLFAKATHMSDLGEDENELHLTTGIGFAFGKTAQTQKKPQSLAKELEKKQMKQKQPQKAVPVDSDGDMVYDKNDNCMQTPQGSFVDKNGCALDTDSDGVIDLNDQCPNTPKGFEVNEQGCGLSYNFQVHFAFDSSILDSGAKERIEAFAQFLKAHDEDIKAVEIAGHTDAIGTKKYNRWLSQRRAKAVYDNLLQNGVAKDYLTYKGYGESMPLVENDTETNRALNRRVEGHIKRK